MRAWPSPEIPTLPVAGPPVALHDTATGGLVTTAPDGPARLYVCGITPYDATHLGHAATYVGFDLLNRAWRNAGHEVIYVQNVTDVDDPLLERAEKVNVDWVELAERETELFRQDMTALRVLPPAHYIGAVESIPLVVDLIERLQAAGVGLPGRGRPLLLGHRRPGVRRGVRLRPRDDARDLPASAAVTRTGPARRTRSTASCGAAPATASRPGTARSARGDRAGTSSAPRSPASTSAARFDVQGGGSDLVFPHHEMCAGHAQVADPSAPFAQVYSHAGMVAYDGEKMSKSRGNLVFVSALRNSDVDPMAIRLALLRHHYRSDWEWIDDRAVGRGRHAGRLAARALAGRRRAPAAGGHRGAGRAGRRPRRPARGRRRRRAGWTPPSAPTGHLADTSDPDAAADRCHALLDAALGLAL